MKALTIGKKLQIRMPTGEDLVKTALLVFISRASVMGIMPFGMSFWAATIPARSAYLGLLGMLAGVYSAGGDVLKYSLAAGIYLAYTFFRKNKITDSVFCGFSLLCGGIASVFFSGQSAAYIAASLAEAVLAAFSYPAAHNAGKLISNRRHNLRATKEDIISAILACGLILTGLSGIYVAHSLHIGIFLGMYITLCVCGGTSVAAAGGVGVALGFLCGMGTPSGAAASGVFGVGAILACLLGDFGKTDRLGGFLLGGVCFFAYTGGDWNEPVSVYEYLTASAMYLATPKSVLRKAEKFIEKTVKGSREGKEIRIKEYISGELKQISKAFTELAESFLSSKDKRRPAVHPSDMFDEVAERVCSDCPRMNKCWVEDFSDMYRYMYGILKVTETEGYCGLDNLPLVFRDRCICAEKFIGEFNHLYEFYKQTAMWMGEAELGRDMVARQYEEISKLIMGLSEEVETGFSFLETAELKLDGALERAGVFAKEINVIENMRKEPEVYISAGFGAEPAMLEELVSEVIGMPMRLENNSARMKFSVHNKYYAEYAVCQHSGDGESVCGDTVLQFETEDNKFCVLLCDGMGLGDDASEESRRTATLLRDFIKAGFIKNTAVKMINSTLAMQSGKENFSAVDIAELDLRSGKCEFLKVGAAQSYILHNGEIEILCEKALPVGILDDIQIPAAERALSDGDIIVMASDGVSEAGHGILKGEWVKETIARHSENVNELADELIKTARKKAYPNECDDMTAAVIKLRLL